MLGHCLIDELWKSNNYKINLCSFKVSLEIICVFHSATNAFQQGFPHLRHQLFCFILLFFFFLTNGWFLMPFVFFSSHLIKMSWKIQKGNENCRADVYTQQIFADSVPCKFTHFRKCVIRWFYCSLTFQGLNLFTMFSETWQLKKRLFAQNGSKNVREKD